MPEFRGNAQEYCGRKHIRLGIHFHILLMLSSLGSGGGSGASSGGSSGGGGLVLYTTEAGGVHAIDPRSGGEAWRMATERPLGVMQASASDAAANWLLLGSSTGHCVLWDLRYSIQLSSWQCPNASPIRTMLPVRPPSSLRPTVLVGSDDNLVCGWEVGEKLPRCTLVLQPSGTPDTLASVVCGAKEHYRRSGYTLIHQFWSWPHIKKNTCS